MRLTISKKLKLCWEILTAGSWDGHGANEKQLSTFMRGYSAGAKDERLNSEYEEQLLNKYRVILNGKTTQYVYSRVNSDAYSVYQKLVNVHRYNPEISVEFDSCEVEPALEEGNGN